MQYLSHDKIQHGLSPSLYDTNCYPSRSPHLVDGIRTLIVLCAQWQQQLPLVECPLSALLRAFCSSDTRPYS